MTKSLSAQTIRPALWCLAGLLIGGLLVAGGSAVTHRRFTAQNERLRAELTALTAANTEALRRLEDLNGQLAVLRQQPKQGPRFSAEMQARPAAGVERSTTAGASVASEGHGPWSSAKRLTLQDLPREVQSAIERKAGPLDIKELEVLTENGQWVYQVQGQTSDGRRVGLRLSPDGTVVTGKSEVPVEILPNAVRETVAQTWGAVDMHNAREILHKDQALYELGGQLADGRNITLSLTGEGTLLSAETEVFPDDLPQPVHNAIAVTLGAGANPMIRQIYADERLTYDVGLKTETHKTRLVLSEDGAVVGFESWSRPPKNAK